MPEHFHSFMPCEHGISLAKLAKLVPKMSEFILKQTFLGISLHQAHLSQKKEQTLQGKILRNMVARFS